MRCICNGPRRPGGPALTAPQSGGFGTLLAERSIRGQLGGTLRYDWQADGLTLHIAVPLERIRT